MGYSEDKLEERRCETAALRDIDLTTVLRDLLGMARDESDKLWKKGAKGNRIHRIHALDHVWFDFVSETGGYGAIDLVCHVEGTDFAGARERLGGKGKEAKAMVPTTPITKSRHRDDMNLGRGLFRPPVPCIESWPKIRRHLLNERYLDASLIDAAHDTGNLYATAHAGPMGGVFQNTVFLHRDLEGHATGAEVKGISRTRDGKRYSGLAAGSRKDAGAFMMGNALSTAKYVLVTESAIDAISALMWARSILCTVPLCVISTAGNGRLPRAILEAIPQGATKLAGQDRDDAGNQQAAALGAVWRRQRPPLPHKDWNDWAVAQS